MDLPARYRGRVAPSPTGYLHLGHARTFLMAQDRCRAAEGTLILRVEDIDQARCKLEYRRALYEDLRWMGIEWEEGPDCGGPYSPYLQSERTAHYRAALCELHRKGVIYPCRCSRQDVLTALGAPHSGEEEPPYPGTCRPAPGAPIPPLIEGEDVHWRFRVPEGEELTFLDLAHGPQRAVAGQDFGDFVVWRRDDVPAYQLAVVVDDAAMEITEVVRGADLLLSTFRQLLIYRALGATPPAFYHAPLVLDPETGERLAKRHAALSLRQLRAMGADPALLLE